VENIPPKVNAVPVQPGKLFVFLPGLAFTFLPESCSPSHRNAVRLPSGKPFNFHRILQTNATSPSSTKYGISFPRCARFTYLGMGSLHSPQCRFDLDVGPGCGRNTEFRDIVAGHPKIGALRCSCAVEGLGVAKTGSVVDSATYDLAADEGVDNVTRC
jgi:hypothetical protein